MATRKPTHSLSHPLRSLLARKARTPVFTPFPIAHRGVGNVLIKAGADLEAKQAQGFTAVMLAAQNGHE